MLSVAAARGLQQTAFPVFRAIHHLSVPQVLDTGAFLVLAAVAVVLMAQLHRLAGLVDAAVVER